jgi:hypothetical protein
MAKPNVFRECNARGEEAKMRVKGQFDAAGAMTRDSDEGSAWDFQTSTQSKSGQFWVSIEVKNEDRQINTGNLCIEVRQGDPPRLSGILVTGADVCVHTLGPGYVAAYRTFIVRSWAERAISFGQIPILTGDNNNHSLLFQRKSGEAFVPAYWEGPLAELPAAKVMDSSICHEVRIETGDRRRPLARTPDNQPPLFT